jgi:hypothetical protein
LMIRAAGLEVKPVPSLPYRDRPHRGQAGGV